MSASDLKLADIASRIAAHLHRFENDPKINAPYDGKAGGLRPYYYAGAYRAGSRVGVTYITYQGSSSLKKAEALAYLAWLDAGNVGRHYEQQRAAGGQGR